MAASDKKMMAAANPADDVNTLIPRLALEYQAIAAYQVGAESGLLQKPVLERRRAVPGRPQEARGGAGDTVTKLGGKPVTAKPAASYGFPTAQLKTQADVLRFAAGLEKGAASAYLGAVPVLTTAISPRPPPASSGRDHALAVLLNALGENPVPGPFIA